MTGSEGFALGVWTAILINVVVPIIVRYFKRRS